MLYSAIVCFLVAAIQAPLRCRAHLSFWNNCMYGFTVGAPYKAARPLSNDANWFFHGYEDDEPEEICELRAGETFMNEIACNKRWTSYGSDTTDPSDPTSACPDSVSSYHATLNGDEWTDLLGCALAIADSNEIDSVAPEDFTVFSVNQYCVTSRETPFEVPEDMPSCSHDWCLCAWTWAGQNSQDEMYHIGFKCRPTGVQEGVKLLPAGVKNARNPWYSANISHQNVTMNTVGWENKPSYLDRDNFSDGGQEDITTGCGSPQPSGDGEEESASASHDGELSKTAHSDEEEQAEAIGNGFTDTEAQPEWEQSDDDTQTETDREHSDSGQTEESSQDQSWYFWKGKNNASCTRKHMHRRRSWHWLVYRYS